MKVQSDILCAEKRRSVQAVTHFVFVHFRSVRWKPRARTPYRTIKERPQNGNLGGNTESFRPMQKGEKRLFILRKNTLL